MGVSNVNKLQPTSCRDDTVSVFTVYELDRASIW